MRKSRFSEPQTVHPKGVRRRGRNRMTNSIWDVLGSRSRSSHASARFVALRSRPITAVSLSRMII
jgi:hypothetical protein